MSQRPIMDAGPGLNFFSLNKERLLFATLGPLAVPEIVEQEIARKSRQDQRFKAGLILKKAAGGEHLPDRNSMRELYERLRALDDGLAPLDHTGLIELPCW